MLLTITTTATPATDLGFLLHKHPDRVQEFDQTFGVARVVYPEASQSRCTAALLVDVDPVRLARSRSGADYALGQYVNDRPYAASSLLAVALADVFRTARAGRCAAKPELAATPIPLEIRVPAVRGSAELVTKLFEPLGWTVDATPVPPSYVTLTLTGTLRVADALNHLYVLLPVLDDGKHYWVASDEVEKLIRAGTGWLANHPEQSLITRRFLRHRSALTREAFERLAELGDDVEEDPPVDDEAPPTPLGVLRREIVAATVAELDAKSVIDLGCGQGQLLSLLATNRRIERLTGTDVSARALLIAGRRLRNYRAELFQGALTYADDRFAGYDAAVLMEVIEHIDPPRLRAMEQVVFGKARPRAVIVTTPNAEYNVRYEGLTGMRHSDHRFEWTRAEFRSWAAGIDGYDAEFRPIGADDPDVGPSTQLAILRRRDG